jgi:nitrate/nitrite transporter NarK
VTEIGSSQQNRVLTASTLAFTTCFAVGIIFSIIGLQISKDLQLSETEFGLLVGTPIETYVMFLVATLGIFGLGNVGAAVTKFIACNVGVCTSTQSTGFNGMS